MPISLAPTFSTRQTMTDEQIKKAGDAYILKRMLGLSAEQEKEATLSDFDLRCQMWNGLDMTQAYADGMRDAMASLWVRVVDALPEQGLMVLVFSKFMGRNRYALAHYDGENWYNSNNNKQIYPSYWMDFMDAPEDNS